jgi:hypothetical protein
MAMSVHAFLSFFMSPSRMPLLARRLNSRDRIRTKLASESKDGVIITLSTFTPSPNLSGDTSTGTTIDIIDGFRLPHPA